jgi:hypothetical protein
MSKDGGTKHSGNVGTYIPIYTASYSRDCNLHPHRCKKLNSAYVYINLIFEAHEKEWSSLLHDTPRQLHKFLSSHTPCTTVKVSVEIQSVHFVISLGTAALSYGKPAPAGNLEHFNTIP